MGMSIDKAIDIMEHYEEYGFALQVNGRTKVIETMRKYQKITEIVEAWRADVDIDSCDSMGDIREVIEDGKNVD